MPDPLEKMMPDAWRVFFRHRYPRPIQKEAIPKLLHGFSALISSPTASGKSEAAFGPLYQRHVSFNRRQLSTIYVAPTKALVNDMHTRLTEYFCETSADIVQRYTGDHHDFTTPAHRFALLTTPEALDSLQLLHPEPFQHVRSVVIDELHLLHGNARGQQLRHVLSRLRASELRPSNGKDIFQTVAMTATLDDQKQVAAMWLGKDSLVISAGDPRDISSEFIQTANPSSDFASRALRSDYSKFLVFANTRNFAHEFVAKLHRSLHGTGWPVFLHFGILSKTERETVEHEMKYGGRGICVATSTLEVGIDIGDVDVVVLLQPPSSISSFLQRIGRGNRRSGDCRVWCFGADDQDERLYSALRDCACSGIVDDVIEYGRPSVEFQQVLSLTWAGVRSGKPLNKTGVIARSGWSVSATVIEDMLGTGVLHDIGGALVPADFWMDMGDQRRIHTVIVGGSGVPMIDVQSGETLGSGESGQAGLFFAGSKIRFASRSDESGVYLETCKDKNAPLAHFPTSRRGLKGLSRHIAWQIAASKATNPREWRHQDSRLYTWGGDFYNTVISEFLLLNGVAKNPRATSEYIEGVRVPVSPRQVRDWILSELQHPKLPDRFTRKFREATRFNSALSSELQSKEARSSVPLRGMLKWLDEDVIGAQEQRNPE